MKITLRESKPGYDDYSFEESDHEFEYKPDYLSQPAGPRVVHLLDEFKQYCNSRGRVKIDDNNLWLLSKDVLDDMAKRFEESHTDIDKECVVIKRNPTDTDLWFVDDVVVYETRRD